MPQNFASNLTLQPGLYYRAFQVSSATVSIRYGTMLAIMANPTNSSNVNGRTETKAYGAFTSNPTTAFDSILNGIAVCVKVA